MLPEWTPCQLFITLVTINKGRCLIILARGRSTRSKTSLYSSEKNGDKPCVIFNVVREQLCTNKGLEVMIFIVFIDPDFSEKKRSIIFNII